VIGDESIAARTARLLADVCTPVVEVGPNYTSLDAAPEDPPGEGPLTAIVAGASWLATRGDAGPVIVLAVDLPNLHGEVLSWLIEHPANGSVVPVVDGRAQPLCARYSEVALARASALVRRGERSMRALLDEIDVVYADESDWGTVCNARAFDDVDTPEDAARAGISVPPDPH
jgi:molybdopterin-guanine dinucleotide biosynthesis protein A